MSEGGTGVPVGERLARIEETNKSVMDDIKDIKADLAAMRRDFTQHTVEDAKTAADIASINKTLNEEIAPAIRGLVTQRDHAVMVARVLKWIVVAIGVVSSWVLGFFEHLRAFIEYLHNNNH